MKIPSTWISFAASVVVAAGAGPATAQTYTVLHNLASCGATEGCNPTHPGFLAQGPDGNLYGTLPLNSGTLFSLTPSGAFGVVYPFQAGDGTSPKSGLTLGLDGNLYGTAVNGGGSSLGSVYAVVANSGYKKLYSFSNASDGAYPWAPPVQAPDMNLYGVSYNGATPGTIYRITPQGVFSVIATLGVPLQFPLTWGFDGNFYGVATNGGTNTRGLIFRVSTGGQVTALFSFDPALNQGYFPSGEVIFGMDGYLYGTTSAGGNNGYGVIYQFNPNNGAFTVLHHFSSSDGYASNSGLVQAPDGYLYGVQPNGGTTSGFFSGTLYRILPDGTKFQVLHNFQDATGSVPYSTLTLHTNGRLYGTTTHGGTYSGYGTLFSLDAGIRPFARIVGGSRFVAAGTTITVLGQGFQSGVSSVMFGSTPPPFAKALSDTLMIVGVPTLLAPRPLTIVTSTATLVTREVMTTSPPACGTVPLPITQCALGPPHRLNAPLLQSAPILPK